MIAISTDYKRPKASTSDVERRLNLISKIGFTHIHWCDEWDGNYIYSDPEMEQIRDWLKKYNLKVKSLHASDGTRQKVFDDRKMLISPNEYNRLAGVELVKNRVDLASKIGAKEVVLHIKLFHLMLEEYENFEEKYWTQLIKSFDELEDYCGANNIKIAIENMEMPGEESQIAQFDRLFKKYDSDFLGFCFDSGHGAITNKEQPLTFLERYKNRLIALHINDSPGVDKEEINNYFDDYDKVLSADEHNIPFTNAIDWNLAAKIIADSPYELPVTLEVSCNIENEEEFLKKAYEAGVKINDMVAAYKNKK